MVYFEIFFFSVISASEVLAGNEQRLAKQLLDNYERLGGPLGRPVANDSEPLTVYFGLVIQQLLEVDEEKRAMTGIYWQNMVRL